MTSTRGEPRLLDVRIVLHLALSRHPCVLARERDEHVEHWGHSLRLLLAVLRHRRLDDKPHALPQQSRRKGAPDAAGAGLWPKVSLRIHGVPVAVRGGLRVATRVCVGGLVKHRREAASLDAVNRRPRRVHRIAVGRHMWRVHAAAA